MIYLENYFESEYQKELKDLYYSAFPKEERPPFFYFLHCAKKKTSELYVIRDEKKFIGLACFSKEKDLVCLMWFAIDEKLRGQGYGTSLLNLMKEKYQGYRLSLACEKVSGEYSNYEERKKRKSFYEHNGYKSMDYIFTEYGVDYEIMCCNGKISKEEYRKVNGNFFGQFLYNLISR